MENGGSGSGRNLNTIIFFVKLGYKPNEMFYLLQRDEVCSEMKINEK